MQCGNTNFTINKGIQNEFIFTIKQNDVLLPMIIDPLDTFSFKMLGKSIPEEVEKIYQKFVKKI